MPRQYAVVDHLDLVPTSYYPSADEAMAAGRTLAASVAVAQGFARTVEEQCEDGTLIFGEFGEDDPDGIAGDLVPLAWVDELGRI